MTGEFVPAHPHSASGRLADLIRATCGWAGMWNSWLKMSAEPMKSFAARAGRAAQVQLPIASTRYPVLSADRTSTSRAITLGAANAYAVETASFEQFLTERPQRTQDSRS